ncbi:YkvA family protein [Gemmatimonadota bacterium]
MTEVNEDFYQAIRNRIRDWLEGEGKDHQWARYVMAAPDMLHLLCRLSLDPDVPVADKAKLAATLAYFISPIDLAPEIVLGPIGYLDDVALSAYVLNSIMSNSDPAIIVKHWAGDEDVLEFIREVLRVADEMLGSGLWRKLKGMADKE